MIDLDTPAARDPVRVGGKAAALAAARAAGVAALPGFVVEGSASRDHMELGANTLPGRGSGGARLVVSGRPIDFADALVTAGEELGDRLVARSSTLLETSGEWSGAFTSYLDIAPAELPKAIVGCWASAFSVAALERQEAAGISPGSFPMSVLVQPALQPVAGGWAEVSGDGTVSVHGVKGSPVPLLQGWDTGATARHREEWSGDELIDLVGVQSLDSIRKMLDTAHVEIGANRCEWALTDRVWALQFAKTRNVADRESPVRLADDIPAELVDIARTVVLAPGALGEEMVLPWALGGVPDIDVDTTGGGTAPFDRARQLCRELTEDVWGLPWVHALQAATRTMRELRGGDPGAVMTDLRALRAPDPDKASRLLAILRSLRVELTERGVIADQRDGWHLHLESIEQALEGRHIAKSARLGIGRWEPLVASVILGTSQIPGGTPASPGIGAGRRVDVVDPHRKMTDRRAIIAAARPIANLASLLWDASGLVTTSGSPAAHLFEAARALRLPAVCGIDLGEPRDEIVAVDGYTGIVGRLDLDREL